MFSIYENIYGDYFKSWPKNKEQLARFTENCRKYIAYTKLVQDSQWINFGTGLDD